jgi:hypothetical protein
MTILEVTPAQWDELQDLFFRVEDHQISQDEGREEFCRILDMLEPPPEWEEVRLILREKIYVH